MNFHSFIIPLTLAFLAGLSTTIGSTVFFLIKDFKKSYLSYFMGFSAGVMIYLSFVELFPRSVESVGMLKTNIFFFLGFLAIGVIDTLIPHHYISENGTETDLKKHPLLRTGLMVAFGLMLHNIPEGVAVSMSSLADSQLGYLLALAIAAHNIPEGIAVAVPIYYATKKRATAFKYSFLSGMSEPFGALLALTILAPFLTPALLSYVFAFVAGVMVFICFDELLPCCFKYGHGHVAISGIITGMALIALTTFFL